VLSAEIIVIALGTVADQPFSRRSRAGQHWFDHDGGRLWHRRRYRQDGRYWFLAAAKRFSGARFIGKGLLLAAPKLMKALTVIGTAAMFLVGGGILSHGVPPLHHGIEHLLKWPAC
jgi:predicted DNA repair protein MutK